MKTKTFVTTMGLLAVTLGGNVTMAATDTTTFQVTATVDDACSVSATNLAFGTYDPNTGDLNGTSTITASCTEGTTYDIGLDAGLNAANASGTTRAMVGATNTTAYLSYELYSDSARSTVWGDTVGTDTVSGTASAADDDHTVYGQIPGGQFVPADSYSDTIAVTITY